LGKNDHKDSENRPLVPEERRRRIAERIRAEGSVTVAELEGEFGISPMTARRDLAALEGEGRARRTHGGAVLPGFAGHEDSFAQRLEESVEAKSRLALAATALLEPGEAVFVDSSTTAYYAARRILENGLRATLLTNLVPVMRLVAERESPNVELVGLGGALRPLTRSYVGPGTTRMIRDHFADKAFISVKGVTPDGHVTDPDPLEAEVKRTMVERSEEPVLLVDAGKFGQRGLHVITHVSAYAKVLVADATGAQLESLRNAGATVRRV
jgi:DeoR/GlpR family transcriptional regulator of sugar metabolism